MATLTLEELAEILAPGQPIAGLDLGTKTIGLSVSDLGRRLATPRPVLKRVKFTPPKRSGGQGAGSTE